MPKSSTNYRTPAFRYGQVVRCERFGEVQIVGLTDAPIPWPIGKRVGVVRAQSAIVLYRDLVRAVKTESVIDLRRLFGVGQSTVNAWRHALGIAGTRTPGTFKRLSSAAKRNHMKAGAAMRVARKADESWKRKIAAAKLGKPRPRHVIEAMRKANIGRKIPSSTRQKMSDRQRQRIARTGRLPPAAAGPAWTPNQDKLLSILPAVDVARRTKRSLLAVYQRRRKVVKAKRINGRLPKGWPK